LWFSSIIHQENEKMKEEIDLKRFWENLKEESDRGVVLISAELIHNCLTDLFEKHLVLNSKSREGIFENPLAPLHTFSNKIRMAYSLGLIDEKHHKNLEYIRKIRNKFAHRIFDASFDDPEIISWCKKLNIARLPSYDPSNSRHLFYDATYYLAGYLHGRISCLEKKKYSA
jgi:DNA-binding MltR family transcriptional regulator